MGFGKWAIERDASTKRLNGLVARVGKRRRGLERDPRPPIAEGEIGGMVELKRCAEIEACPRRYHRFVAYVCLRECWREVDAGASGPCGTDSANGRLFFIRRGTDGDFVARRESAHVADFDIGRTCTRIGREIRATRLGADARDRDIIDSMATTVDVQPDFVTDRDVGN